MNRNMLVASVIGLAVLAAPSIAFSQSESFQQRIQGKLKVNRMEQQKNEAYYDQDEYVPVGSKKPATVASKEALRGLEEKDGRADASVLMAVAYPAEAAPADLMKLAEKGIAEAGPSIFTTYLIYRTNYKAEIEDDVVTVKGTAAFEVFRKGWTAIPLITSDVGLIDAVVSRGASFVTQRGNRYYLMVDRPGKYTLDIEFLVKARRERENGPGSFSVEVMPAPISQFEFTIPDDQVEIFVDPSIKTELRKEAKKTVAWAVMPNTNSISVRWTKALPKETITPVKLEPKVYVDTTTYAAIGDGVIRCLSTLTYSILQSEVPSFRIALPEDVTVLGVLGNDLRDWKVSQNEGTQYIDVYPNFGIKGTYLLTVNYERKITEGSGVAQIPSVTAMGVEREKGYFGIAAATSVELAVNKSEHVSMVDVKDLPQTIWSNTTNPILLAFKYLNHPFNIEIEVTKHEEVPVLVAAIDSASYTTLQTDEGKNLTKAVYQVRNNVKQFVHLMLPSKATLWSVFVAGKPVKPAKDKNGAILIPLEKSQMSGESLAQFPVEVVYLDTASKMRKIGRLAMQLPKTDIPISSLTWSVFLPFHYAYTHFGGDVKPVKGGMMAPQAIADTAVRHKQRSYAYDKISQNAMMEEQAALGRQVPVQTVVSSISGGSWEDFKHAQTMGMLPIKIDIPEQGRMYRFSKLLVTENESPKLSIVYYYTIFKAGKAFRFLLTFGILFLAYVGIKALLRKPI